MTEAQGPLNSSIGPLLRLTASVEAFAVPHPLTATFSPVALRPAMAVPPLASFNPLMPHPPGPPAAQPMTLMATHWDVAHDPPLAARCYRQRCLIIDRQDCAVTVRQEK